MPAAMSAAGGKPTARLANPPAMTAAPGEPPLAPQAGAGQQGEAAEADQQEPSDGLAVAFSADAEDEAPDCEPREERAEHQRSKLDGAPEAEDDQRR